MPSYSSTFQLSFYMTPDQKQTASPSTLHTDQSSVHEYVRLKPEFGSHWLMTSFRPTLSAPNRTTQRNPPGRPDALEPFINHFQAAGALPSGHYKKIVALHPHKKPLRKSHLNLFARQSHLKKKTSSSQPLPDPDAHATNSSFAKSHTERSPIASDNSDSHLTLDVQKRATHTSLPYSKHLMESKLHTHGCLHGPRARCHST